MLREDSPSADVFLDCREFLPQSALLHSSAGESWRGGLLNRFRLQRMPDQDYCYTGHMVAVPRSGRGVLRWRFEGRRGVAPVLPSRVSIQPSERFLHRCEMQDVVCDTLHLDPEWLRQISADELPGHQADLRATPHDEDALLVQWIDLLGSCIPRRGEAGAPLLAEEILARIGMHLLQHHGTHGVRLRDYRGGLAGWRLRRVFERVESQIAEPISLAEMAHAAGGMSVFHFSRLFRQSTGMTPHRYVLRTRLHHARARLEHRRADLTEVAMATGFYDHSHLTRSFKRVFGLTPSEFQRRGKSKIVQASAAGFR